MHLLHISLTYVLSFTTFIGSNSRYGKNGALDVTTRSTSGVLILVHWVHLKGLMVGHRVGCSGAGAVTMVTTGLVDLIWGRIGDGAG
jgi:hypothetical protein